jgi:hypothetical protein
MPLAAFVLALAGQAVPAPEPPQWERVNEAQGLSISYAPASVQRDGDRVQLLMRVEMSSPGPGGMSSVVFHSTYDCRSGTATLASSDAYAADGHLLLSTPAEGRDAAPRPIRGTPAAPVFQRVCPQSGASAAHN